MSYYDTIDGDLKRAKEILERGKLRNEDLPASVPPDLAMRMVAQGGTIHALDIYAAYKLLESFVQEIEQYRERVAKVVEIVQDSLAELDALETEVSDVVDS